jgi:putative transposase
VRENIPHHGKSMGNLRFREFYRRRLPHIQIEGATYFVTFRLANSLPVDVLKQLAKNSNQIKELPVDQRQEAYRRWFEQFDDHIGRCLSGESYLQNDKVAEVVADSLHRRDGRVYELLTFCIMPNHVHAIFTPLEASQGNYYSLTEILHSLKRNSAKQANTILGRTGPFWQDESYDHVVRDQSDLERIVQYVLYNPVKAGLTEAWQDWQWSYSKWNT